VELTNRFGVVYELTETTGGRSTIITSSSFATTVYQPMKEVLISWEKWRDGEMIQRAFPYMNAEQREFIMTGITPTEWNRIFNTEKEEN